MDIHLVHWIVNFLGINNGQNEFSTHMYNFWSGFGGNISVLALIGTVFGVYRHNLQNLKRFEKMNPLYYVHNVHKKDKPDEPSDTATPQ